MSLTSIEFNRLRKLHTSVYLADVLCTSLCKFGILDKLLSVPGDNASTNTKLLQVIKAPGKLLDTLDNLQQLEYEDGTFGCNAVMKVSFTDTCVA